MTQLERYWFDAVPWSNVVALNRSLCQAKEVPHEAGPHYQQAEQLWQQSLPKRLPLRDALEICRQCFQLAPFAFHNGNTFATIGKTLVDEVLKPFPGLEAHIVKNTIGHYIAGRVGKKELQTILHHFQKLLPPMPAGHAEQNGAAQARTSEVSGPLPCPLPCKTSSSPS